MGFAGSKHLDERRRRRLAGETDHSLSSQEGEQSSRPFVCVEDRTVCSWLPRDPLVQLLVPRHKRPVVLWSVLGFGVCLLSWLAGVRAAETASWLGTDLAKLFDLHVGRMNLFLETVWLLLASQLALLIWWIRSASPKDFEGHYRVWLRAALVWFGFAWSLNVGGHWAFSRTVLEALRAFGVEAFPQAELLIWLVPTLLVGFVLFRQLKREMSGFRGSRAVLYVGAGLNGTAALLMFRWPAMPAHTLQAAKVGCLLGGQFFIFLATWLHARYVVYVNADLPPGYVKTEDSKKKRKKKKKTSEKKTEQETRPLASPSASQLSTEQLATDQQAQVSSETQQPQAEQSQTEMRAELQGQQVETDEREPAKKEKAGTNEDAKSENKSVDTEEDSNKQASSSEEVLVPKPNLKGLSKRERRKLRKQWREQQRLARQQKVHAGR